MVSNWLNQTNLNSLPHVSRYKTDYLKKLNDSLLSFETQRLRSGLGVDLFPVHGDPTDKETEDVDTLGLMEIISGTPEVPCGIRFFTECLPYRFAYLQEMISQSNEILATSVFSNRCEN